MANQFTYCGALENLKAKLQWEDESLTEIEERFRLMGILYYAAVTIRHFEDAIKRAEKSIIIRDLADVDFDYWTNINHWDIPGWLTPEELKEAHLWQAWNIHNNREYIGTKLANDMTGLLPAAPKMEDYNDGMARNGLNQFLQLFQGVYFNSNQLRYALYQAVEALIATLKNLQATLLQERKDEEYAQWYTELSTEFQLRLINDISKRYETSKSQRILPINRDWLMDRLGNAAQTFWATSFMQALKENCTNNECKNQTIHFDIPELSKDHQRKFFHLLLEFSSYGDSGFVFDKPAQAGKFLYRLYLTMHEQALVDYFAFQVFAIHLSSILINYPPTATTKAKKPKQEVQVDKVYMTFCMADINVGHVNLLRQKLIEFGWIPKDTQPDAFSNLFSGMPNNTKIVWTGKVGKGTLAYLFKKMEEQQKITVPQSYNINPILEAHFVDKNGKYLTGLHKGKDALRHLPNIQKCLDVLYLDVDFD